MLQLENNTPFAANMAIFADEAGIDTLYLIVKATFNISSAWTLADEQEAPQLEDVYWGEPGESSIKLASDFHLGKPSTDIIVSGNACAPNNEAVSSLDVGVSVGDVQKRLRVFGDRHWQNGGISRPASFSSMPLVYERAFGGAYMEEGQVKAAEERNPVGLGFVADGAQNFDALPLPNLEDPDALIQQASDRPEPACFAFKSPSWQARARFAGTYDEIWQNERAPFLPLDFDRRFFSMAHSSLVYPRFLEGGEAVEVKNMHPSGDLKFVLPKVKFGARVKLGSSTERPAFNLETLHMNPSQLLLAMTWKAAVPCDKQTLKISQVDMSLMR